MRHIIITLPIALACVFSACDSPDDEAELQALDIKEAEQEADVQESEVQDLAIKAMDPTAAKVGQLCQTDSTNPNILYTSPNSGIWVPPWSWVRILDYRGPYHYLARYKGTVGQLERGVVIQSSCHFD